VARITATIRPVHDDADQTDCTHSVTSTGKPRDPESGCTGRAAYTATCSAGDWTATRPTRAELEYLRDVHSGTQARRPTLTP
jgi:hypothetical protein